MMKRKLQERAGAAAIAAKMLPSNEDEEFINNKSIEEYSQLLLKTSPFFSTKPFWQRFYEIEIVLNQKLQNLGLLPVGIQCTYNPIEYAAALHCAYLRRFCNGRKRLVFLGMNPGPNGMGQTGVPFGNIGTVRDIMELNEIVEQPALVHPKRPITGLLCKTEEPSGVRLWNLFIKMAGGSLDTFSAQCYVHNFCPLAFFDAAGKNITPSELKGDYKLKLRDVCLEAFNAQLELLQPEIVVAVGEYVHTTLKKSKYCQKIKTLRLPHPSPRSLNNHNWPEKAEQFLKENDLVKYMRNEA